MARGFSAKYNPDIKRLDVKGQYWSRKDAETAFHILGKINKLGTIFDCIIDITDCDIDAIRLEKFIEVAIENGLRFIVIVVGDHPTKDWLRDGFPIEKKQRFSQATSYIEDCIIKREQEAEKVRRTERANAKRLARLAES
ncbi:MAG: hypothetical protein R3250_03170 [Melioribacteraceae bacterium]|nr:hypothetical protein [Melioribacteraceae bacterium]